MLIECIGPQASFTVHRRGMAFTWEPQEKYGGAKVLDVTDPGLILEFVSFHYQGKPLMRRFELDALQDPEFIRQVIRNPEAIDYIRAHPEEFVESIEKLRQELREMSEARLRMRAAELNLPVAPTIPHHMLLPVVEEYYARKLTPKADLPDLPAEAVPETVKNKGGRPRKVA